MRRLVIKFGRSALQDITDFKKAAHIIQENVRDGFQVVVVVSGMGRTQDGLTWLAKQVEDEPNPHEMDLLLSAAEQTSASLMALAIQNSSLRAKAIAGSQSGIITTPEHGNSAICSVNSRLFEDLLRQGVIPVVAGHQGSTVTGEITRVGRGGSDITAVALAKSINATRCDLYTDMDGIHAVDPVYGEKRQYEFISYQNMRRLTINGGFIVNIHAIAYAMACGIPLRVRSIYEPDNEGTLITSDDTCQRLAALVQASKAA
jgi:aspartate kinase